MAVVNGPLAHLWVALTWGVASAVCVGWGAALATWWGGRITTWRDVSLAFWMGAGAVIATLQLWHFLLPVDGRALALIVAGGALGLALQHRAVSGVLAAADRRTILAGALVILWISNRALGVTTFYDTGMYHQPFVAWSNAGPLVPGLGNLHGRLAFNSSSLLLASAFDLGPFDGRAPHLLNGWLTAVFATEALAAWRSARGAGDPRPFDLFTLAVLPSVAFGALTQDVRSLSTDATVCLVLFAGTRLVFDGLATTPTTRGDQGRWMAAVLLLFTTAVTVKLSAAVMALASVMVVAWSLRSTSWPRWSEAFRGVVVPVLLFVGWVATGIVLSGYPLYPASVLGVDVPWRVPGEQVSAEAAWIVMSARNLNSNVIYPGASWVVPWLRGVIVRGDLFVQLPLPLLLTAAVALRARTAPHRVAWAPTWRLAFAPAVAALAFWVVAAPHTRMAQGIVWGVAAMALAWSALTFAGRQRGPARLITVVAVVSCLLGARQVAGLFLRAEPGHRVRAAVEGVVTLPASGVWMAPLPVPRLADTTLPSGLRVAVPIDDNSCWNTPGPCTPHPSAGLALRYPDAGPLAGFISADGRWAPRRWPNPWTPFLAWWRCTRGGASDAACLARTPPA
ncbi:MAG: hypothetical protein IT361_01180 [Gemmatimonadaceae bacterium]|nr:hypothetical protein [Gemmatimonadaceae bacterium]